MKFPKPSPQFFLIIAALLPIIIIAMMAVQFQQLFRLETQVGQVMVQLNAAQMPETVEATVSAELGE